MSKKKKVPLPILDGGCYLIDTHCHLDMSAYEQDLESVLDRARQAGVAKIVSVGIDLESSGKAIALAEKYPFIHATVGVHPHYVESLTDNDYNELAKMARHPQVVAFGEIGMDLVKDYAPVPVQKEHFVRQVALAKELDLPLVIHDREAHADVLDILRQAGPFAAGGVMHCFSGDAAFAVAVQELGFVISIPGVVTFNKAEMLQEAVRQTPLSALILETDGPYLSPVPRRGKRNEPESMLFTAQKVAELKGIPLSEVARQTSANAEKLFGLQKE